jgi:hypothetical protein
MFVKISDLEVRRRRLRIAAFALLLALGAITKLTHADNGSVYVAPGPSTLIPPEAIKHYQEQSAGSARKLGDLIGSALKSPSSHATDLVVTTKCGHYQSATITYADGTVRSMSLGNAQASEKDMDQAKAAIPYLRIVDLFGCEQ